MYLEFIALLNLTRNDLLGIEQYNEQKIEETVEVNKYGLDVTEVEFALEGLSYFILHVAKSDIQEQEQFAAMYEQSGLKEEFFQPMYNLLKGSLVEIRQIMTKENQRGAVTFKDMNWRLSMVTACRQRQKMMFPKFTVKLDLEEQAKQIFQDSTTQSFVLDLDFTSMQRL